MDYIGVETADKILRSVCNESFQPYKISACFICQLSDFFGQLYNTSSCKVTELVTANWE